MKKVFVMLLLCSSAWAVTFHNFYLGGDVQDPNSWSIGQLPNETQVVYIDHTCNWTLPDTTVSAIELRARLNVYDANLVIKDYIYLSWEGQVLFLSDSSLTCYNIVGRGMMSLVFSEALLDKTSENIHLFKDSWSEIVFIKDGDINKDGSVDFYDLALLANNWLQ